MNNFVKDIENEVLKPAPTLIDNDVLKPEKKHVTATELLERGLVEVPKLIEPILQRVGLASLVGSSDTGKSSILRQMAIAVVTGQKDFLGFEINAIHKKAICISTEDDENSIASLLYKYNRGQRLHYDKFKGLRFVFETENLTKTLDTMLTEEPADLVIIDAFSDLYSGAMNEGNKVRSFLNEYHQLAQKHECLIVFLHHCGKRTEDQAPSKSSVIGSQSFEAKMRVVIELRQDFFEPMYRHLCIVKGNYLPSEFKQESYVLRFDENMTFHETGRRVPFQQLERPSGNNDEAEGKYESLMALIGEGKSQNEAAQSLGISKGQASKLKAKFGGVSSSVSNGNSEETLTIKVEESKLY